ncbi:unnamed protein product [Dicrocoelium dendriticum]|nr:unnamed protein product [Dicrocoelium dendriticum]
MGTMTPKPPTGIVVDPNRIELPSYTAYEHPSTKWLLNTFRKGASNRLIAMLKERPHLFRQTFQIFDCPSEVMADASDTKSMFHSAAILYLRPLCLAIYMRCRSAVQILLASNLCDPLEYSYASDVYVQLQGYNGGDLLELLPACVAIRRQFWEILPNLFHASPMHKPPTFTPRTAFTIRYLSRRMQRTTMFEDLFHYATDLAPTNRHINIVKILEVLINYCPGFYVPGTLDECKNSEPYSLFRRLAHLAVYMDINNRISFPLIQCMEALVRNSHFRPCVSTTGRNSACNTILLSFKDVRNNWEEATAWIKDCYICATLLFRLYALLVSRLKTGSVSHAGNLLFRVLVETNLLESTLTMSVEELGEALDFIIKNDRIGWEYLREKQHFVGGKIQDAIGQGDDACSIDVHPTDTNKRSTAVFAESLGLLMHLVEKLRNRDRLVQLKRTHALNVSGSYRAQWIKDNFSICKVGSQYHEKTSSVHVHPLADRFLRVSKPVCSGQMKPTFEHGVNQDEFHQIKECRIKTALECRSRASSSPTVIHQIDASNRSEAGNCFSTLDTKMTQLALTAPETCDTCLTNSENYRPRPRSAVIRVADSIEKKVRSNPCNGGEALTDFCNLNKEAGDSNIPTAGAQTELPSVSEIGQTESDSSPRVEIAFCEKACQAKRHECRKAVSALIVKKRSVEKLSLRDVDQLIDCIAMSALANEKEFDGQTIEDLFHDYMEQGSFPSSTVSRANSSTGTQICCKQAEAADLVHPDTWVDGTHSTIVTPEGAYVAQDAKIQTRSGPYCTTEEGIQQKLAINFVNPRMDGSDALPNATDREGSSNYRKFLWSCAKPISHLNVAFGALKHHISVNRRSVSRVIEKASPRSMHTDSVSIN